MKRIVWIFLSFQVFSYTFGQCSHEATVERLLQLLTQKGVLTEAETAALMSELKASNEQPVKQEMSSPAVTTTTNIGEDSPPPVQAASQTSASNAQKSSPSVKVSEMIDLSGDLRLRYDSQIRTVDEASWERRRPRYRLRFGLNAEPLENLNVGFRLASGNGLQNTTNQSFDGHGTGNDIFIDRVYADWKPAKWFQIYGGKHRNIFGRTPLVWDTDVNLVGSSQRLVHKSERFTLFGNFTQFIVEELDLKQVSDADPIMLGYQGGMELEVSSKIDLETIVSFYDFRNLHLLDPTNIDDDMEFVGYNNRHGQQMVFDANGNLLNEFRTIELGAKFKLQYFPQPLNFFGHYIRNTAADIDKLRTEGVEVPGSDPIGLYAYGGDNRDTGYQFGLEFGFRGKKGDFFIQYFYQVLEDFAFPAVFVDSDFHNGGTNNRGHRTWVSYYLHDKIHLQGLFYFTQRDNIAKDGLFDENRGQFDIIFDF
jgi:hypothetical protein